MNIDDVCGMFGLNAKAKAELERVVEHLAVLGPVDWDMVAQIADGVYNDGDTYKAEVKLGTDDLVAAFVWGVSASDGVVTIEEG